MLSECFLLDNPVTADFDAVNSLPLRTGFITELYTGVRNFYTERNAKFIDTVRQHTDDPHVIGQLIVAA